MRHDEIENVEVGSFVGQCSRGKKKAARNRLRGITANDLSGASEILGNEICGNGSL